jgi:hypothetical protein
MASLISMFSADRVEENVGSCGLRHSLEKVSREVEIFAGNHWKIMGLLVTGNVLLEATEEARLSSNFVGKAAHESA